MKVINRYFRNQAKSLIIEYKICNIQREIRRLRSEQKKYFKLSNKDDKEIRDMFNNGIFSSYSEMTDKQVEKIFNTFYDKI